MAKVKLTNKALEGNPLGEAILQIQDLTKRLTSLSKKLEGCFVSSLETSEPIVDPFIARALLSNLESDPLTLQYLDAETLSRLKAYVASECKSIVNSFESRLIPFCKINNISIEGRFPSYMLGGFLQIRLDQSKGLCKIGPKTVRSLMLESIAPVILEEVENEGKRSFNPSEFLRQLYEAYIRVTKIKGLAIGQPAQILEVFQELIFIKQSSSFKKNPVKVKFEDYTKEFFSRDLVKTISSRSNTVDNRHLELLPTAFPHEDGLPIRTGVNLRYVGRVVFRE